MPFGQRTPRPTVTGLETETTIPPAPIKATPPVKDHYPGHGANGIDCGRSKACADLSVP
jgi:hypothetical protein